MNKERHSILVTFEDLEQKRKNGRNPIEILFFLWRLFPSKVLPICSTKGVVPTSTSKFLVDLECFAIQDIGTYRVTIVFPYLLDYGVSDRGLSEREMQKRLPHGENKYLKMLPTSLG